MGFHDSGVTERTAIARARTGVAALVTALLVALLGLTTPAGAASPACQASQPAGEGYSVRVCLTVGSTSVLSGEATTSATVSITGTSPGVRRVQFTLDGGYLLTDFESPYSFLLPTASFLDGDHTVQVTAELRDGNVAASPAVATAFANGTTELPPPATGFTPTQGTTPAAGQPLVVAVTGDGASGRRTSDSVVDLMRGWDPNLFLYTGDVYEKGTETEFLNWYGRQGERFGTFKSITNPIVGNHEYENGAAPGYFGYWAGVPDYYSYDVGGWHFVALNSTSQFGQFEPTSPQYRWLEQDLAEHEVACTMAVFHHPVVSVGPQGDTPAMNHIWRLLADRGVDIVLTGHDHQYQRWVRLGRNFAPDPNGIVQFVAGGGGHGIQSTVRTDSRVAAVADTTSDGYGALRMELSGGSAQYSYISIDGAVRDSGTIQCSGVPADTTAPTVPADVTATPGQGPDVLISWSAATDNQGVSSYEIRRDGEMVADVPATQRSWLDTTTAPVTAYEYQVRATDLSGNTSDWSAPAVITTADVQTAFTWLVSEDAYVDSAKPTTNYGRSTQLRLDAASPVQRTYLRFAVAGIGTRAPAVETLRIRAATNLPAGFEVRTLSGAWTETGVNYQTPVAVGALLARSGPVTAGTWVEIPISGLIDGDGTYDLALIPLSPTALRLDSRESGAPAELLADVSGSGSNVAPVAQDVTGSAWSGTSTQLTLSARDVDGDCVSFALTAPTAGTLSEPGAVSCEGGIATARVTYTAPEGWTGTDTFSYTATDPSGLSGAASGTVEVSTAPAEFTVVADADAYVSSSAPTTNYGSRRDLRVDADAPVQHSYVRFSVTGLGGAAPSALRLRVHAASTLAAGFEVRASSGAWAESTVTFDSAPGAATEVLATSGPVTAGTWLDVPLPAWLLAGDGPVDLVLTPRSATALRLDSRETATAPELIVTR